MTEDPGPEAVLHACFPELAGRAMRRHEAGWDSVAIDVDDELIFKFPRNEAARAGLRREASLLAVVRPRVRLPVPALTLFEGPPLFSRHAKLPGEHLLAEDYARLPDGARDRLADTLAQFYAQLHAIDPAPLRAAGARDITAWLDPERILREAWPALPQHLHEPARRAFAAWEALPPDPGGTVYGFFDGHGWNMAFDPRTERLNGIYDFADSGFGPRHQEFIYAQHIAPDLAWRIVDRYEAHAGTALDRVRIHLLTGLFWLSELGGFVTNAPAQVPEALDRVERWSRASAPLRPRPSARPLPRPA